MQKVRQPVLRPGGEIVDSEDLESIKLNEKVPIFNPVEVEITSDGD